jgi:hypothetical protein
MLCRPEQHTASHIQEQHQVFFTVLAQEQNKNTNTQPPEIMVT